MNILLFTLTKLLTVVTFNIAYCVLINSTIKLKLISFLLMKKRKSYCTHVILTECRKFKRESHFFISGESSFENNIPTLTRFVVNRCAHRHTANSIIIRMSSSRRKLTVSNGPVRESQWLSGKGQW